MIKIVCDLMGADKPANELVSGVCDAINANNDLIVNVVAKKELVEPVLNELSYDKDRVIITDCGDPITNNDVPTKAFKTKPDSSLIKGLNLAKDADGFVSCGATGAVLVSSMFILGRIGKARPALSCVLPGKNGAYVCISDCGANVDSKPEMIVDFAKMGVAYMKARGVENPRVKLLSNGVEEHKGPEAVKAAHLLLKESGLNFLGNIEGKEALDGSCDVVAADGFAGNLVLKTVEGAAKQVFTDLMIMAKKSTDPVEAKILKETVMKLLNQYDFNAKGGATLLGVTKPVVKGHGAAVAETVKSIILDAYQLAKNDMVSNMKELLGE